MIPETDLSKKMRAWAVAFDKDERRFVLVARADELDAAVEATLKTGAGIADTKRMLGAWARARKAWCEVSGEPLI